MLTKKQQIKLILLTGHEKYGQLLADAIETWKIAKPSRYDCGLIIYSSKFKNEENPECCLLGAAFAGKQGSLIEGFSEALQKYFNINESCFGFIEGFDTGESGFSDARKFASEVSKIIFEDK
jgi:hypothetical protein